MRHRTCTLFVMCLASMPASALADDLFSRTLQLQGISFTVAESANGAQHSLTVTPVGLSISNEAFTSPLSGKVVDAEVADLNVDGSPEVYIYLRDDKGNGDVLAYAANHRKSLSQINLPPLAEDKKHNGGYRGGDEFAVVESSLARRFPLHDANGKPTGKMRQLQYKLEPGEASWQLVVKRATEF